MQHFYDGQVRRYITQVMRLLSNFPVKDGDGNLKDVPVLYGDLTRQVASIIKDNSENKLPSAPRMSVYVTGLELDRDRTMDSTFINKLNIREREYNSATGEYLPTQGANYTVERIMPTPYTLKVNCDIWSSSTDQKLQILEQILVWFNPALEIQTTDNFVDWTSVTVVNLESVNWSNRSVPVGVDSTIDVATLSFSLPIYITPPSKVKRMGVITNIITSIFDENTGTIEDGITRPELNAYDDYIKSGFRENEFGRKAETDISTQNANTNYKQYGTYIEGSSVKIISRGKVGAVNWRENLEAEPGNYIAGVSRIYLSSLDSDSIVTGTFTLNPLDETEIIVNWDADTFPQDSIISGPTGDKTTIDYIINPLTFNPTNIKTTGVRLLLLEDVGDEEAVESAAAWKNNDDTPLIAGENDIVEWDGTKWVIVMDASETNETIYVTNLNTSVQYRYTQGMWLKSVEGEYPIGTWRLDLYG